MPVEAPPGPSTTAASPNLNDAFSGLDQLAGLQTAESPPAEVTEVGEEAPPAERTRDDTTGKFSKPAAVAPKTAQETPNAAKPAQTAPTTTEQPRVKAKTLAEAKHMAESDRDQWRSKYEALHQEFTKTKDDPEKKSLAERLEAREKRLAEIEQELRYTAYEKTEEYKDKYEAPFLNAYTAARAKVASIKVRDGRTVDHDGNVVSEGTWRQGTAEDFDTLMRIQDDETAADYADKVFGQKSSIALYHRERTQELNRQRLTAIDDYRKKGSEREKLTKEQQDKLSGDVNKAWGEENDRAAKTYPQWFAPAEGDEKGNALLQKGFEIADMAFVGHVNLPPVEKAKLHAAVRNKAGGFDRLAYLYANAQKELKDLKAKLGEYEKSEPSGGTTRKPGAAAPTDDMEGVLSSLNSIASK